MSSQVFVLEGDEWMEVIAQYLGDKYPHLPDKAQINFEINRRTKAMTVEVL